MGIHLFKRRVGVLSRDMESIGGGGLSKGERVIYYRSRRYGMGSCYEWCYERIGGGILIRSNGRYIDGKEEILEV